MSSPALKLPTFRRRILPGFGLSLGFTLAYLGLIVLIPLSAAFLRTSGMTWEEFWAAVASPRVVASYKLSFGDEASAWRERARKIDLNDET